MDKKTITLQSTVDYPCSYVDLIDRTTKETIVTIYTLKEKELDGPAEPGMTHCVDGIHDIVLNVSEITENHVIASLKQLSKEIGIEYKLE